MTCPVCGQGSAAPANRAFRCQSCAALVDGSGRLRVGVHDDGWSVARDRIDPPVMAGLFTGLVAMPLFLAGIWAAGSLLDLVTVGTMGRSPWLLAGLPGLIAFGALWAWSRSANEARITVDDRGFAVDGARRSFAGVTRLERTHGWLDIPHPDGDLRVPDPDSRVYDGLVAAIERYDAATPASEHPG